MKKIFLFPGLFIILVCFLTSCATVPTNKTEVKKQKITVDWKTGDVINYKITSNTQNYQNAQLTAFERINLTAQIEIIAKDNNGYTLKWTEKNVEFESSIADEELSEILKATQQVSTKLAIIYSTDLNGKFLKINNLKEIQNITFDLLDEMSKTLFKDNQQAKIYFDNIVRSFMTSPKTFEQQVAKNILLIHYITAGNYAVEKSFSEASTVPNLLGGEPLPATINFSLSKINTAERTCSFEVLTTLDKDESTKIIYQTLIQKFKQLGHKIPDKLEVPAIQNEISYTSEINYSTGWPEIIINKNSVAVNNNLRLRTYTFEKLD